MRILLIQRDNALSDTFGLILKSEGMIVYPVDDADEAVDCAKRYDYDLILLDPDLYGCHVLRDLRSAGVMTPVLIVSSVETIAAKVAAFERGADDYLTKPFYRDELVARILAIVRRTRGFAEAAVTIGDLTIRMHSKTMDVAGIQVHLTGKEYQMIEMLALRKGAIVTKEMFLNHIYGGHDEPEMKIIDVFICKLRKKMLALGATARIETIWGRGYMLDEPRALAVA